MKLQSNKYFLHASFVFFPVFIEDNDVISLSYN